MREAKNLGRSRTSAPYKIPPEKRAVEDVRTYRMLWRESTFAFVKMHKKVVHKLFNRENFARHLDFFIVLLDKKGKGMV